MTPPHAQPVSAERPRADVAVRSASAGAQGPFVINLCSSTTPMALSQPRDPALARFTFFMSRRLEDGRERFRLHMGYFESLTDAEEWLAVVREIYPGAWAGEAPGKRLRARAAEPEVRPARPENAPVPVATAAPIERVADAEPAPVAPAAVAATPIAAAAVAPAPIAPAPVIPLAASASSVRTAAPPLALEVPVLQAAPVEAPIAATAAPAAATATSAPLPSASRSAKAAGAPLQLSNVREVLASLDETGVTRQMPSLAVVAEPQRAASSGKPASRAAAARSAKRPAEAARPLPAGRPSSPARPSAARPPEPERNLSDTQVLKLLESRRSDGGRAEDDSSISLLKPDDTGTRRALKEAVAVNAPVSFAVQLQWSVQPIDAARVPPLAIFSAYTLYTVEGSREGRRWYGLRLGFFSDAISAKQVAHYVRSEFNSVAVVPVSPQERSRASDGGKSTAPLKPTPPKSPLRDRLPEPTSEFKLIDDEPPPPAPQPASRAAKRTARTAPGRVRLSEKRSPQTLEETLEILGADQLEIDNGRGESLNDTGVRHLTVQVRKSSPFTKLLDRLSERARGK